MIAGKIRVIALGIVRHENGSILFDFMRDPKRNIDFLRPIGGGVSFSESSQDAIKREFREEIGATVGDPQLLKVFENIFEYNGNQGHEIVFLFEVKFENRGFYDKNEITVTEGQENRRARWYSKAEIQKYIVLPPQIVAYI